MLRVHYGIYRTVVFSASLNLRPHTGMLSVSERLIHTLLFYEANAKAHSTKLQLYEVTICKTVTFDDIENCEYNSDT